MNTSDHVVDALRRVPPCPLPFPWFFAQNVFPPDVYASLLAQLDDKIDYHTEKFANRTFSEADFPELKFMYSPDFLREVLHLFLPSVQKRFGGGNLTFTREIRMIRDQKDYKIGPHTDAAWKVVSLLFYMPRDESMRDYGTAIYVPRHPDFTCEGGPHYKFDPEPGVSPGFKEIWRAPFLPNTCLGFFKTNKSFHGVPPIPTEVRRDVLLYNIYSGAT
jgi:hypothetical protein